MTDTRHAPVFLRVMHKVEPFIRDRYPKWGDWSFEQMSDQCAMYWNRGTMSLSVDCFGEIHGLCLIKLFRYLNDFLFEHPHDPCGKFCWVELMIADYPQAAIEMKLGFIRRWGPQEIMMWDRGDRTEGKAPRMYTWDQYNKLTRRLSYGVPELIERM
jgi:hypothetical protein